MNFFNFKLWFTIITTTFVFDFGIPFLLSVYVHYNLGSTQMIVSDSQSETELVDFDTSHRITYKYTPTKPTSDPIYIDNLGDLTSKTIFVYRDTIDNTNSIQDSIYKSKEILTENGFGEISGKTKITNNEDKQQINIDIIYPVPMDL